ncbi:hypothetical protein KFU94_43980 [Chloroflexi bacterium TSY]|nr:hypothetical protein [Chloroflexi bacterium TSY]
MNHPVSTTINGDRFVGILGDVGDQLFDFNMWPLESYRLTVFISQTKAICLQIAIALQDADPIFIQTIEYS